jgi:glycogen debranching enzyme
MSATFVRTANHRLDSLVSRVEGFLARDTLDVVIDGDPIRGYRSPDARSIWIRDYSDMLRGVRYFEPDVKSVVEHFAATQAKNGRVFDYFTTFPEKLPSERENWTKYVRVPVEADVEYRFVKAAWLAYQACGDREWIEELLPSLERALDYAFSHPWRWDEERGLVRRPYTIDTWDFAYTAGRHEWLQFQIDEFTFWGVMHGDISGYFEACRIVAALHRGAGREECAEPWEERARALRKRLDVTSWNGRFYTHFVKDTPVVIEGVDEAHQLSLSNPMNINRGVTSHAQAVAILREYRERGERSGAFADWFSIDPPFPDGIFGDDKLVAGSYCNGGIMPLVGGELARAAFEHGFESYGVEILERYHGLVSEKGETYLWYHPDGTPSSLETSTSPDAMPTDGWGSSAMLYALIEGLVGISDRGAAFDSVTLAPRWFAAGLDEAEVRVGYAASGAGVGYALRLHPGSVSIEFRGEDTDVRLHCLLPQGTVAAGVRVDGESVPFANQMIEESRYVDAELGLRDEVEVKIVLATEERES